MSALPAPRRPRARWFGLPAALLALAVALGGVALALREDEPDARDRPPATGSFAGVVVDLVRDDPYEVYASPEPGGSVAPGSGAGTICVLNPRNRLSEATVARLRDDRGEVSTLEVSRDGTTYVYLGSFTAPLGGNTVVSCAAIRNGMLLQAGETPRSSAPAWVPAGAIGLAVAALLAFAVLIVLRRSRPGPPPDQPGPPPQQPGPAPQQPGPAPQQFGPPPHQPGPPPHRPEPPEDQPGPPAYRPEPPQDPQQWARPGG